jgi:hypothetical protein
VNNCGKYPKQTETASSGIEYTTNKKERHKIFLPYSTLETTYSTSTNKIIHKETKALPHCKQAEHTDTSNSATVTRYIQKKNNLIEEQFTSKNSNRDMKDLLQQRSETCQIISRKHASIKSNTTTSTS